MTPNFLPDRCRQTNRDAEAVKVDRSHSVVGSSLRGPEKGEVATTRSRDPFNLQSYF